MTFLNISDYRLEVGKVLFPVDARVSIGGTRTCPYYLKAPHTILQYGKPLVLPRRGMVVDAGLFLAASLQRRCRGISKKRARDYVLGLGLVLDITDGDLLNKLRDSGHPGDPARNGDGFCPISEFMPLSEIRDESVIHVYLERNGKEVVSTEVTAPMDGASEMVSRLSGAVTLLPADIVAFRKLGWLSDLGAGDVLEGGASQLSTISVEFRNPSEK